MNRTVKHHRALPGLAARWPIEFQESKTAVAINYGNGHAIF